MKKTRELYDSYNSGTSRPPPLVSAPEATSSGVSWQRRELPRLHEDILCRTWRSDPYVLDATPLNATHRVPTVLTGS